MKEDHIEHQVPEVRQCSDGQGGEAKRIYEVDLHQRSTEITLEQNEPFFACELAFSMPDEEGMAERDIDDGDGWQEEADAFYVGEETSVVFLRFGKKRS